MKLGASSLAGCWADAAPLLGRLETLGLYKSFFMPQPTDFFPNEAWVLFRLNDTPIRTELHGDFNCFAMMDAASTFILGTTLIPANQAELTLLDAKRLFKLGAEHKLQAPRTLFVPQSLAAQSVAQEAHRLGVEMLAISPEEMAPFVAEAKASFKQYQDRRPAGA